MDRPGTSCLGHGHVCRLAAGGVGPLRRIGRRPRSGPEGGIPHAAFGQLYLKGPGRGSGPMAGAGRPAGRHGGLSLPGRLPAKLGEPVSPAKRRHPPPHAGAADWGQQKFPLLSPLRRHRPAFLRELRAQVVSGQGRGGGFHQGDSRPGDCGRTPGKEPQPPLPD